MLIHDDIEDESEERRGRPTLHKEWGIPIAINVGDTLSLLSFRPLLDNRHRLGLNITHRIVHEAERVARESAEGQGALNSVGVRQTILRSQNLTISIWF